MNDEVETLERATLAAVPPQALEELPGWLVGLDGGTVGRAHSAVPLSHAAPAAGMADRLLDCFGAHGMKPVLRLPRVAAFGAFASLLAARGLAGGKPTLTMTGLAHDMERLARSGVHALLERAPGAAWTALFLGEGFDPRDAASRLEILQRARGTVYGCVRMDGEVAAVGTACFAHGWMGVHGMRTAPRWRGQGLAGALLAAFGRQAQARGIARAFLQVEERNTGAQSLYRRAGFSPAWAYEYWQ